MILLDRNKTVLIRCEEEIAASYCVHRPIAGQFAVAHPYQAAAAPDSRPDNQPDSQETVREKAFKPTASVQASSARDVAGHSAVAVDDNVRGPEEPHERQATEAPQLGGAAEPVQPAQGRKRKRKQHTYQPNAQEQQAEVRHAAFQDALVAAAAATQTWLAAHGGGTLAAAMATARCQGAAEAGSSATPQHSRPPDPHVDCACEQRSSADSDAEAGSAGDVDYIALAALKATLHPKLRFSSGSATARGRTAAADLFDKLISNDSDTEAEAVAHEAQVLLPPRSRFLMSDITRLKPLLPGSPGEQYQLVVLDPPWENASAKRAWRYPTLPSRNLLAIPMRRLLAPEGSLVALWMTNRERHWRFVERELLPAWGLAPAAAWLWLKVADDGRPVTALDVAHRRPYEVLLLAAPATDAAAAPPTTAVEGTSSSQPQPQQQLPPPPQHMVIVAVPGEHSRKPQLGRLLRRHVHPDGRCLEMFARELAAGWTSWGNEPLRFQASHRFERIS